MKKKIYTIGYTGFKINTFIKVLKKNKIDAVVDIRSYPFSKYYPDYNSNDLKVVLEKNGILYRLYDKEFGARQKDYSLYDENNQMNFTMFSKSRQFQKGILRLQKGIENGYTIVLMCAEKDPLECHRFVLVGRELSKNGFDVMHILENEQIISEKELELLLVDLYFPHKNQLSIFESDNKSLNSQIEEAFKLQSKKIAFQEKELLNE